MKYKSTRNSISELDDFMAIINGIAPDGGLYIPNHIPKLDYKSLFGDNYENIAAKVINKYFDFISINSLEDYIKKAYSDFSTNEIVPLKTFGHFTVAELYHGPTLAFKDIALSLFPYLLVEAMNKAQLGNKQALIITATSGDTGKAALSSFCEIPNTNVIVFYPKGMVSKIQELQMITQEGSNVHTIAFEGNFDDAQRIVKSIFLNDDYKRLLNDKGYFLTSANSINIARLVPQITYYYSIYIKLVENGTINNGDKIDVSVPTGNFGNILAGYMAKKMGLPINNLICTSNENDVLYRFFNNGTYDSNLNFYNTISPSMDILISSNLERFLYFEYNNSSKVVELMNSLKIKGEYNVLLEDFKEKIIPMKSSEIDTNFIIKKMYEEYSYLTDPHTAVGLKALENKSKNHTVVLSTASPFKFPEAILTSLGIEHENLGIKEKLENISKLSNMNIPNNLKFIEDLPIIHKSVANEENALEKILEVLK
jgi:threonine synthase